MNECITSSIISVITSHHYTSSLGFHTSLLCCFYCCNLRLHLTCWLDWLAARCRWFAMSSIGHTMRFTQRLLWNCLLLVAILPTCCAHFPTDAAGGGGGNGRFLRVNVVLCWRHDGKDRVDEVIDVYDEVMVIWLMCDLMAITRNTFLK